MIPKVCDYKGCLELSFGMYYLYDTETHYCEMNYCMKHAEKILTDNKKLVLKKEYKRLFNGTVN